jgi:hypothetical protein
MGEYDVIWVDIWVDMDGCGWILVDVGGYEWELMHMCGYGVIERDMV